jgi:cystathionine beta-synthase
VGEDFWPDSYDPAVPDEIHRVGDAETFEMTRRLAREEGLLVGGSSGMAVVAALRTARDLPADAVVVVLLPDHGRGYLNRFYDDGWMRDHGFDVPAQAPVARAEAPAEVPGVERARNERDETPARGAQPGPEASGTIPDEGAPV